MMTTQHLVSLCDSYKLAAGLDQDKTASYRIFGDSKKLTAMRSGASITVERYGDAIAWLRQNWPEGREMPLVLKGGSHPPASVATPAADQGALAKRAGGAA